MYTIIGGGIAGLSAAYRFIQQGICPTLIFTDLGGRIYSQKITIDGSTFYHDMGAEYFLSSDTEMMKLLHDLDIELEEYISQRAIYNPDSNRSVVLPSGEDSWFTSLRKKFQALRYLGMENLSSASILRGKLPEYQAQIKKLYDIINNSKLSNLFWKFKLEFGDYFSMTLKEYLVEREGLTAEFVDSFVDPLFHAIYMIGSDRLNALYGILGFASKFDTIYHAKGGNHSIIEALFEKVHKDARVINKSVTSITKTTGGYEIKMEDGSILDTRYVYCATPLQALQNISFNNFTDKEREKIVKLQGIEYNKSVYHHLVRGVPNAKMKELFRNGVSTVFVANSDNIVEINRVYSEKGSGIFDISSQKNSDETSFLDYFDEVELVKSIHWDPSYPLYTPETMKKLPVSNQINDTLFCGTDSLIASMGTSVLTSKYMIEAFTRNAEEFEHQLKKSELVQ